MIRFRFFLPMIFMACPLIAGPLELQVEPIRSTAHVELCLSVITTACDTDASAVAGTISVSLDCPPSPGEITLHDFALSMVDDVTFELDYSGQGQFSAVGTDVGLNYADPGNPMPPAVLVGDAFTYTDVPAATVGQLEYLVTGFVCFAFQLAGYECDDVIDLSTITLEPLTLDGLLVLSGSDVELTVDVNIVGPVDPDNPDLGTLRIEATIVATGQVPPPCCPGDLTGDDRVDLDDHRKFVDCLTGPSGDVIGACQCADLDGDDDVDLGDFADFGFLFAGS